MGTEQKIKINISEPLFIKMGNGGASSSKSDQNRSPPRADEKVRRNCRRMSWSLLSQESIKTKRVSARGGEGARNGRPKKEGRRLTLPGRSLKRGRKRLACVAQHGGASKGDWE